MMEPPTHLHLGCGKKLLPPPWFNVDKRSDMELDYCHGEGDVTDLRHILLVKCGFRHMDDVDIEETEIEDGSIEEIYACHVLDHLSRNGEVDKALSEWYRVLRPGGILRVAVSDFEKVVRMYTEGLDLEWLWGAIVGGHKTEYDCHGSLFDFTVLRRYLEKHGFRHVKRYDWRDFLPEGFQDNSCAAIPKYDLTGYPMSLNVVCLKLISPLL